MDEERERNAALTSGAIRALENGQETEVAAWFGHDDETGWPQAKLHPRLWAEIIAALQFRVADDDTLMCQSLLEGMFEIWGVHWEQADAEHWRLVWPK